MGWCKKLSGCKKFKKYEEIGIKTSVSTGDPESSEPWLANADIIVCTSEKFDSLLRHNISWLNKINIAVFDEIHLKVKYGDLKIRTIYCEQKKLKDLIKNIKKDKKLNDLIKQGYAFHIRYNENDKHIKIYDPDRFGERLVFFHKGWTKEQLNQVERKLRLEVNNA